MLLSIIIPVYNGEKKIKRCLDRLLMITEPNVEFIVVNDGSLDNTKAICEEYAKKDVRFSVINKENGGVSSARNKGLECCHGKYISFVDADDEVMPGYENIVRTIKEKDHSLFGFDYLKKISNQEIKVSRMLWRPGLNNRQKLLNNFLASKSNNVWANIYKHDLIIKHNIKFPQNIKMGEDCFFNAQFFQYCSEVYYIDEVGYKYYADDMGSASNANKASYLKDFVMIHEKYMEIYRENVGLEYPFNGKYYLKNVYNILKSDRKNIKRTDRKEFRNSDFFQKMMVYKFSGWKWNVKKWIIYCYMYLP